MTWTNFLHGYAIVTVLLAVFAHRKMGLNPRKVLRVASFTTAVFFLGDYIAEDRRLWVFSSPSSQTLLDVPVENIVFSAATTVVILVIHRAAMRLFPPSALRQRPQGRKNYPSGS